MTGFARLFLLGATVITVFDGFHTHGGATRYTRPVALLAAWWAPLLFGVAVSVGGLAYRAGHHALFGDAAVPSFERRALGFTLFGLGYFASGYLPASNAVKAALLLVLAGVLCVMLEGARPKALLLALVVAITGPLFEVMLVRSGTFAHLQPDFLGIPVWLAPLYLCAAPALGSIARAWLPAKP